MQTVTACIELPALAAPQLRHLADGGRLQDQPGRSLPRHDPNNLEKVYGHLRPDHQSGVSDALSRPDRP